MDPIDTELIDAISAASRTLVRELGLVGRTLAGTRHAPSTVHALHEIGREPGLTAAALAARLHLEKSSVSRLLRKLVDGGEVVETDSEVDGRARTLSLTRDGRRTLRSIEASGRGQVARAIGPLSAARRRAIGAGLVAYAEALEAIRPR